MSEQRLKRCGNCRNWKTIGNYPETNGGDCHRNPPVLAHRNNTTAEHEWAQRWPWTAQNDYCGEWSEK